MRFLFIEILQSVKQFLYSKNSDVFQTNSGIIKITLFLFIKAFIFAVMRFLQSRSNLIYYAKISQCKNLSFVKLRFFHCEIYVVMRFMKWEHRKLLILQKLITSIFYLMGQINNGHFLIKLRKVKMKTNASEY